MFEVLILIEPGAIAAFGRDVTVAADDPAAVAWAAESAIGTALWEDTDEDGLLSPADARVEPLADSGGRRWRGRSRSRVGAGARPRVGGWR